MSSSALNECESLDRERFCSGLATSGGKKVINNMEEGFRPLLQNDFETIGGLWILRLTQCSRGVSYLELVRLLPVTSLVQQLEFIQSLICQMLEEFHISNCEFNEFFFVQQLAFT